jgi:hypothetical protein
MDSKRFMQFTAALKFLRVSDSPRIIPALRFSPRQTRKILKAFHAAQRNGVAVADLVCKAVEAVDLDTQVQLYDLFPVLCAQLSLTGLLRTTSRNGVLSLIWAEQNGLRYFIPAAANFEGFEGFWAPYRILDKQRFRTEQQKHERISKVKAAFPPPLWTGEPRPTNYDHVAIEEAFGSLGFQDLKKLQEIGFPWKALVHSSFPYLNDVRFCPLCGHTLSRKQKIVCADCYERRSRAKEKTPAQDITQPNPDGWTGLQVARVIGEHHWDSPAANAVFAVVYENEKLAAVAERYQLPQKTLSQYVYRTRKNLRST